MKNLKLTACPIATEAEVQRALISRLRARGWLIVRVNSGAFTDERGRCVPFYRVIGATDENAGFPDVLAMRGSRPSRGDGIQRGQPLVRLFECKRHGAKLRAEQKRFGEYADLHGVEVEVVDSFEALDRLQL